MTQTYNSTGYTRPFGFGRLLFRWRASIWKSIWVELSIWLALFYFIAIIYWSLPSDNKRTFEKLVLDWGSYNGTSVTVVTFALGFYVTQSFTRWWDQWNNIPWIDPLAHAINGGIRKQATKKGAESKITETEILMIRRTLIRYVNLTQALTLQTVSECVGSEMKGIQSLMKLGLLTQEEAKAIQNTAHDTHVYFIPLTWAVNLLTDAYDKGVVNERMHEMIMKRIEKFRTWCGNLLAYKWIPIPLIYTHVITVAVYFHFMIELVGGQFLDPDQHYEGHLLNWGVPVFDIATFVILVGWLKAAELMKHPMGLDDDAFEVSWIMKRNIDVGLDIVSGRFGKYPTLTKDKFFDTVRPLGKGPRRPGVNTLSFGAEHKGITKSMVRNRNGSYAALDDDELFDPAGAYDPPADAGSKTENLGAPLI